MGRPFRSKPSKALSFAGSPTVRVNGEDIEPHRTSVPSLACRLFANRSGIPSEESLRTAIKLPNAAKTIRTVECFASFTPKSAATDSGFRPRHSGEGIEGSGKTPSTISSEGVNKGSGPATGWGREPGALKHLLLVFVH